MIRLNWFTFILSHAILSIFKGNVVIAKSLKASELESFKFKAWKRFKSQDSKFWAKIDLKFQDFTFPECGTEILFQFCWFSNKRKQDSYQINITKSTTRVNYVRAYDTHIEFCKYGVTFCHVILIIWLAMFYIVHFFFLIFIEIELSKSQRTISF